MFANGPTGVKNKKFIIVPNCLPDRGYSLYGNPDSQDPIEILAAQKYPIIFGWSRVFRSLWHDTKIH
jgi:hypothetical protein